MSLSPVIDYWALLSSLNLGPAYRPSSQPWSLETHGSHIANGVELVPGAPGYQPQLAYNQWFSLLFSAPPLPLPTLSLASSAEGFALTLSVAGTVKMSVSGDLGSFVAGYTLLTAQATVKEGFLTLSANGQTSTATSQYVVLGTAGDDSIDTSAAGNRVDDIFGGAGNDTLKGGAGNDVIVGGAGNDTITGGGGADQLTGGAGADVFIYTTRDESYYAGAGTPLDTIVDFATGTDKIRFSLSGSTVDASSFATVGNFVDGKNHSVAYSTVDKALYVSATGTSLNNTTAGAYVVSSANTIAAGDLEFVIAGTDGDDVLKGGLGNDIITGGDGADSLSGGNGNDLFWYTDNRQLRDDSAVAGGDGIDTIAFSMDIDTLTNGSAQGDNFHAYFERASGIERIVLSGSSHVNLGEVLSTVGLTTIVTGDDSTTLRYDNVALGLLNVEASAMADNKLLSLIPATGGAGPWFNVTGLKGDVNAATLQGGIVVAAAAGAGFDVSITGGHGADTLTGGAGNDTIQGGYGVDTLTGGLGQDTMDGGAGADRYIVNSAQESGVSTTSETAAGFDVVTVGDGDLFDFKLSGLSVYTSVWTMDEAMATTGTNFLSQFSRAYLDAYFNDGTPKVAMAVRFQGGETFLIVDTSGDGTITNADAVVQLVGTVSGLGYSNGLVEINPALWP